MTIKHLVFSGGGPILIKVLSAIQTLEENKILDLNIIESIYGTSAGAILAVIICLKFDWETINDYIIKRPWQDVFQINVQNILDAYSKKGLFDIKTIEKCFKPLFDAKDISIDINMVDFYKLTNIEIHFFTFEINEYVVTDISYLTHPNLSLMTSIQMTCGLPVLVTPVCIDNKCFIDGGMASNYPLNNCIDSGKDENEILGFKNKYNENNNNINEESNLLDFLLNFLYKAIFSVSKRQIKTSVKHEILFDADYLTIDVLQNVLTNIDVRKELFKNGTKCATDFLEKLEENEVELQLHDCV